MLGTEVDTAAAGDRELLRRAVDGSQDAFADLSGRHARACHGLALRILHDEHMAEDVVQEVLVDFWHGRARFDLDRSSVGAWMTMLTRRRAVDRVRYEALRPRPTDVVPDTTDPTCVEDLVIGADVGARVRELLSALSPAQRQCLVLAYWGGRTMQEIAVLTETPVGTVKSRCKAALQRLRQLTLDEASFRG